MLSESALDEGRGGAAVVGGTGAEGNDVVGVGGDRRGHRLRREHRQGRGDWHVQRAHGVADAAAVRMLVVPIRHVSRNVVVAIVVMLIVPVVVAVVLVLGGRDEVVVVGVVRRVGQAVMVRRQQPAEASR